MSDFDSSLPPFRLVNTHRGDDLQAVAARELGDASRWIDLIWLNSLAWPYLTDDPERVADGVLLTGSAIRVPAAVAYRQDAVERGQAYERDILVAGGALQWDDAAGDFAVAAGVDNLSQQLRHRLNTPRGQLRRHPEYGGLLYRLKGRKNGPTVMRLARAYAQSVLEADYRVKQVTQAVSSVDGDVVRVTCEAMAIEGDAVRVVGGAA